MKIKHKNKRKHGHRDNGLHRRNRFYRDTENGILRGVCAGIADYFDVDVTTVRALTLLSLLFFTPATLLAYLIAAVVLPAAPEKLFKTDDEARFWRGLRTEPSGTFSDLRHRFRGAEQRLRGMEAYVTSSGFELGREIDDLER
jgi:phage shock protein C